MKHMSLKKKIIGLVFFISMICPIVAGVIIYKNNKTAELYQLVADKSLPRTRGMGEVLFRFREVRIQFRALALRGNTAKDIETYLAGANTAVKEFSEGKDNIMALMSDSELEKTMASQMDAEWKNFANFGGELIALVKKGDEASMDKLGEMVRYTCPKLADKFEKSVQDMITWQQEMAIKRTEDAKKNGADTTYLSIVLALVGVISSLAIGVFFASSLIRNLLNNMSQLSSGADEIFKKSNDVADISSRLSEAATEQAASLQETVASIDEISAMIARNSDSAVSSAKTSEVSTRAAQKGKDKVELMMDSINAIASGNNEIIDQMQKSNREISEIVTVIKDISQKTQVINDIVFQTKLLSFNASVEAARAGEHGKGFAVVAEEVGNLASMSGKAATEITEMLSKSVKRVTDIVDGTKGLMENLIKQSKEKVELGMNTAKECGQSLDEILSNVSTVNQMVREISTASQEQSTGVNEVNKAMTQLDEVTQQNSGSSQESSQAAIDLKDQVDKLNSVVAELSYIVEGNKSPENYKRPTSKSSHLSSQNVVQFKSQKKNHVKQDFKKAAGMNYEAPKGNDPRFEDV